MAHDPVPSGADPGKARSRPAGEPEPRTGRREWFLSGGSMVLAFLASQHHTFMMLLLALGLSNAAMGFMTAAPAVRRVMLGMSLVMVAVIGYRMCGSGRPRAMRIAGVISIVVTVGLTAWTITRFGL